jgi:hypothetical protein
MKIMRMGLSWIVLAALAAGLMMTTACTDDNEQAAGDDCTICHNETTVVLAKNIEWERSLHGSGESYLRSTTASCAGCHSSEGFSSMLSANQKFSEVKTGVSNPTMPNCRTCHEIHVSYTEADWKLTTREPVNFVATGGTYNAGAGNLCVNCHQPRLAPPAASDGTVTIETVRWGPHHGVQGTSFLGLGGYGATSSQSVHYSSNIKDGCATCHMVNGRHEMTPSVQSCLPCHTGLTNFDYKGTQTQVKTQVMELKELLEAKGMIKDDLPVPGKYPSAQAGAIWNYLVATEDGSAGVHNPTFFKSVLQASIEAVK